ncbi:hypothetical protein [Thalassomonas haliotis]|uniref:Uncharacterized protein n=1 Tax=Thalassomonas haliotis TaxID=485448 RepID=A0ABY7VE95_9GAMM|nr:hypothetical protein [Thalassomonas haliotis]WDE12035.1 hypothetical protein H3N35_00645 [Thalassomonas haliotis]
MSDLLLDSFSKSRAEEYPLDVWNNFVIPPRYKEYSRLFNYHRAVMIEGGRGSGKTMFLKYHCHNTRFSKKRASIPSEELKHVGLYFRPDTDFAAMINEFNFGPDWKKVFTHYVLLGLLEDFANALHGITNTTFEDISFSMSPLSCDTPDSLQKAIEGFPAKFDGLLAFQKSALARFNLWLNDIDSFEKPPLLEPRTILIQLIEQLKEFAPELRELSFYIYFDEFENLTTAQQKVLNNWMKHGKHPLIFNAAYKKGVKVNRETYSNEKLVLRNDYKVVDLEKFDSQEFKTFASEVLLLKLMAEINIEGYEDFKKYFCNEDYLELRRREQYKKNILKAAREFLPSHTYSEIATMIMEEPSLIRRLERFLISPALPVDSKYKAEQFINKDFPEESLINGLLLNRNTSPHNLLNKFNTLISSGNRAPYKSQVEQYLVGAILWVYLSASWKKCPAYAGFDRFCMLAKGNMRHFIELCYQSISLAALNGTHISKDVITPIPQEIQSEAAVESSRLEIEKVDELGQHGEKLRFIVNRLGLFFQLIQKRKSQSENEVNHFSIKASDDLLTDETTKTLIDEAIIWSVLVEEVGDTKRKSANEASSKEYMLHPIFSPHFGISYRRKKKFDFTLDEIDVIFSGSEKDYVNLCKNYQKKWKLNTDESEKTESARVIQQGLFDDFN